jgi:hypothetical protein
MTDSESPPVHFSRDDPRLLGETLILGAEFCFVNSHARTITYECNGQWLRFVAGGGPYRVEVSEIGSPERIAFTVEHTGDGLTVQFPKDTFKPITQLIINAAKDQANRMKFHV